MPLTAISILLLNLASNPDETALRHLKEDLWPTAYREQDVALLETILHESFQMVQADGSWSDKQRELDSLPGATWPHDDFRFQIQRLDVYSDSAIVAGEGRASGHGETGPYCFTYQSTNVLIKSEGRWQAVASHVSGIQPECPN